VRDAREEYFADEDEIARWLIVYPITRIKDGRTLRTMHEGATTDHPEEIGELSECARQAFASMVDYVREYNDVRDAYSMTQRLEVDRDIDALLKTIADEGAVVGAGLRRMRVRSRSDAPNSEPMDWTNILIVLAPENALPSDMGWQPATDAAKAIAGPVEAHQGPFRGRTPQPNVEWPGNASDITD
jgi:hypothetical protein